MTQSKHSYPNISRKDQTETKTQPSREKTKLALCLACWASDSIVHVLMGFSISLLLYLMP